MKPRGFNEGICFQKEKMMKILKSMLLALACAASVGDVASLNMAKLDAAPNLVGAALAELESALPAVIANNKMNLAEFNKLEAFRMGRIQKALLLRPEQDENFKDAVDMLVGCRAVNIFGRAFLQKLVERTGHDVTMKLIKAEEKEVLHGWLKNLVVKMKEYKACIEILKEEENAGNNA